MRGAHPWVPVLVSFAGASLLASLLAVAPATAESHASTSTTSTTSTTSGSTSSSTTVAATSSTTTGPTSTTTTIAKPETLPWPAQASAAVAIPQLSVAASSPYQPRVAIASLTKMMTTWVILHRMPLTYSQSGPCVTVSAHDVAVYRHDVATGQSSVEVVGGTRLCEGTLLRGLLVHSAGNYAEILVEMTGLRTAQFVAIMNRDARVLGLRRTHYVDITGIGDRDTSTAHDQATLAIDLMNAEPIVRSIVTLPKVALPSAGVVYSYTPFVGQGGVVGVKSGYTGLAGGCDVMAVNFTIDHTVFTVYAVVLGEHGAGAILAAGHDALVLARAVRLSMKVEHTSSGRQVRWAGPSRFVVGPTTSTTSTTTTSTSTTTTLATTTTTA